MIGSTKPFEAASFAFQQAVMEPTGKWGERRVAGESIAYQLMAEAGEPILWQKGVEERAAAALAFEEEKGYPPPSTIFEWKKKDHWLKDFASRISYPKLLANMFLTQIRLARGDVKSSEVQEYMERERDC